MPFQLEKTPVDLTNTPVENLFIDLYMPMAPGDFVKVYLLGYRYALESAEGKRFSSHTIATNLNLSVEEVVRAWHYWEEKKLVRRIPSGDASEEMCIEFCSLKVLHLKHAVGIVPSPEGKPSQRQSYTATPADLLDVHEKQGFREFFETIDRLLQRPLVPNEEMQILEWLHHYKVDKQVVILAFQYAVQQKEVRSLPYVGAVIRNWVDEGITSPDAVEAFLDRLNPRYRHYNSVFKSLGFHGRLPSEAERRIMDAWFDEYRFTLEMILKACDLSAGTSKPSIKYINGILKRWYQDGLLTPEAVERQEQLRREKAAIPEKQHASNRRPPLKTGFHLPESRGKDYTNEELEKILLGRKRRPRKGEET